MWQEIDDFLDDATNSVICVYFDHQTLDGYKSKLAKLASKNRIYILTQENQDKEHLKELSRFCLIRIITQFTGNFLLINQDDETKGLFLASSAFSLQFNQEQCQAFWHFFTHCFWQKAFREYIAGEIRAVTENHQEDFLPPYGEFDQKEVRKVLKTDCEKITFAGSPDIFYMIQDTQKGEIYLNTRNDLDDLILGKAQSHAIYHTNIDFNFVISESINMLIMGDDSYFYAITLDQTQTQNLLDYKSTLAKLYTLHTSIDLQEACGREVYTFANKEVKVYEQDSYKGKISCEEFYSKNEFESKELDFEEIFKRLTKESKYPCQVHYKWEIEPFFTPKDYQKSQLYNEWEDSIKKLHGVIDQTIKKVQKIQEEQKELDSFKALVDSAKRYFSRIFLGKNTKLSGIENELMQWKEKISSINPMTKNLYQECKAYLEVCLKDLMDHQKEITHTLNEAKAHNKWQEERNAKEERKQEIAQERDVMQQEVEDLKMKEKEKTDELERLGHDKEITKEGLEQIIQENEKNLKLLEQYNKEQEKLKEGEKDGQKQQEQEK